MGLRLDREHFLAQLAALRGQHRAVDQHAVALHPEQHLAHRHLDVAIHRGQLALQLRREKLVQLQRDVGILRRIPGRGVEIDLVETDLLGALADHVRIGNGLQPEMAHHHVLQVVRLVRLQHVGLQQRILGDARQRDAVVGEDVLVVFEVLTELFVLRAFQPVFQFLQRMFARQLVRRAGIAVRERQVGGLVRLDRKRDADQLRRHDVQAGGFGVDADQLGAGDLFQPRIELGIGEYGFVFAAGIEQVAAVRRIGNRPYRLYAYAFAGCRSGRALLLRAVQVAQQGPETEVLDTSLRSCASSCGGAISPS